VVDPLSIGAIAGVALTEGIKFLYSQADAILKRRAERKAAAKSGAAAPAEPIAVATPSAFTGTLAPLQIDQEAADEHAENLKELRHVLEDQALGHAPSGEVDPDVIRATLALRDAIEDIVGQRITFEGEDREPSGTPVATGRVSAKVIKGRATGLDVDEMTGGQAKGEVEADEITEGGEATGLRVRKLG
jgi:hypothetical protein